MIESEDLLGAALLSLPNWAAQEAMLRGLGLDDGEVEMFRDALEQIEAEAVARIVPGP